MKMPHLLLLLPLSAYGLFAGEAPSPAPTPTKAEPTKLKVTKDPVLTEMNAFCRIPREAFHQRRFGDLEKLAAELRSSQALFGDGSSKMDQFFGSMYPGPKEPENEWEEHQRIHEEWVAARPDSIIARTTCAQFWVNYAWHARGSGYASTVTEQGGKLFEKRLVTARKVLEEARSLKEKDLSIWSVALQIALGEGWPKPEFDAVTAEAVAFAPTFWRFDIMRANSLLPRWYGEPGDWEAYAEQASLRPGGLGDETYARIVVYLGFYYDNVFRDTKASWPKTRKGLEIIREKYPRSLEFVSYSAKLAALAEDRALAVEMFQVLEDRYLATAWRDEKRFIQCQKWAETGVWPASER